MISRRVLSDPSITPEAKGLYAYLASYASDTDECYPSVEKIYKDMGMSKSRFYKHMDALVSTGVVERLQTYNGNLRSKVLYKIVDEDYSIPNNTEYENQRNEDSENLVIREFRNTEDSECKNSILKNSILKNNNNSITCPELDKPAPDPSGILLPLIDKSFYDVPKESISKWHEAYPAVDVEQQLKRMITWLEANPKRRKTRRGINAFIVTWLSREQDKGGIYRNGGSRQQETAPVNNDLPPEYQEMYAKYLGKNPPDPDAPFQ